MLLTAGVYLVHHLLREYRYEDIRHAFHAIPHHAFRAAIAVCFLNYLLLAGYDYLGIQTIGKKVSLPKICVASFISYSVSQTIGLPLLSSTALRYRIYSRWGLSASDVARVALFNSGSFWLGLSFLFGCTILFQHRILGDVLGAHATSVPILGGVICSICLAISLTPRSILARILPASITSRLPSVAQRIAGLTLAIADWLLAAAVLVLLLPGVIKHGALKVLGAFITAQTAGVLSHVPGGLGVFEATFLSLVYERHAPPVALSAIFAYRLVYYLIPFLCGVTLLVALEIRRFSRDRAVITDTIRELWLPVAQVLPTLLSGAVFLTGTVLLLSGASPTHHQRLWWLKDILPLSAIEGSSFLNSVIGTLLLLVAFSLRSRTKAAWGATMALLVTGAFVTFIKGFDYEEALFASVVALALWYARAVFTRSGFEFARLTLSQIGLIALAVLSATWLGFFSYREIPYRHRLWWEFATLGDAPRFMRASVITAAILLFVALRRILGTSRYRLRLPEASQISALYPKIYAAPSTVAHLAEVGDKAIFEIPGQPGFIMYTVAGRWWIAMGDPMVSETQQKEELLWKFRTTADRFGGSCAFYQVGLANLPLYIDAGLDLFRLGEDATVDLSKFTLSGGTFKSLRGTVNRLEREGMSFSIEQPEAIPNLIPQLRQVSSEWLARKNLPEKGFSVGYFSEAYLNRNSCIVVRRGDVIEGFANVWKGDSGRELSVDMMRFAPNSSSGVMDYLFTMTMLWGKEHGFERFNLGVAPLTGGPEYALAPTWSRLSRYLYNHGEHFYNFQGLRKYKEKFHPRWEPRYLAAPGGIRLAFLLPKLIGVISKPARPQLLAKGN